MKREQGGRSVIFWGPHSRHSADIAQQIGGVAYPVNALASTHRKSSWLLPLRYALAFLGTLQLLLRTRPSVVVISIPPPFAGLAVFLYCKAARIPYVLDVHGHSLTSRKWAWSVPLQKFLARNALATVIDQRMYKEVFEAAGARTVMLERSPKNVPSDRVRQLDRGAEFSVTVVSVFAEDEPIELVIEAARAIPDVRFYITGDVTRAPKELVEAAPANVVFTGYLSGDDYWHRMASSNAVMTLTTEAYSLVSGGVESMALGKPTIVSRTPVLTEYFTRGTVFVEHTAESIADGVRQVRDNEERLAREIALLAEEKKNRWEQAMQGLLARIGEATRRTHVVPGDQRI